MANGRNLSLYSYCRLALKRLGGAHLLLQVFLLDVWSQTSRVLELPSSFFPQPE